MMQEVKFCVVILGGKFADNADSLPTQGKTKTQTWPTLRRNHLRYVGCPRRMKIAQTEAMRLSEKYVISYARLVHEKG